MNEQNLNVNFLIKGHYQSCISSIWSSTRKTDAKSTHDFVISCWDSFYVNKKKNDKEILFVCRHKDSPHWYKICRALKIHKNNIYVPVNSAYSEYEVRCFVNLSSARFIHLLWHRDTRISAIEWKYTRTATSKERLICLFPSNKL